MTALSHKLLRDLVTLRGQALAIAAVVASGIAILVGMFSTQTSLHGSLSTYYARYRFADVFAPLKRAPESVARDLESIPGVTVLATRVVTQVVLDVPGLSEPATGRILSLPDLSRPALDDVYLRAGRLPEPGREGEVMVSEAFALANHLHPGDTLAAVISGRWKTLSIVGVGLSPEFIYQIRPGDIFPDARRFGIFWMRRRALENAVDMEGAFNDVLLQLSPDARRGDVLAAVDKVLARWGGVGAFGRDRQMSARFLDNELLQLRASGIFIPCIFLAVAAFLLNVVLTRIIGTQRAQIATLKAFGYSSLEIGWHYLQLVLLIVLVGDLVGVGAGVWIGRGMTRQYTEFFRFPVLLFTLSWSAVAIAVVVSALAGVVGGWQAVQRMARLPPAEAMQPEAPPVYRRSLVERIGILALLSPSGRIVLRNLLRRPGRAAMSIMAIAFSGALVALGGGQEDALQLLMHVVFSSAQLDDVMVTFVEPRGAAARYQVERLPGVLLAEPFRLVAATVRFGHRSEELGLEGRVPGARLRRIVSTRGEVVDVAPAGLVLTRTLGEKLGVRRGDRVTVEVKEGDRPTLELPVVELVDEMVGYSAYLELGELHRLLREGEVASGAYLRADHARLPDLYRRLKAMPVVGGVAVKEATLRSMKETMARSLETSRVLVVFFSVIITFGVVYNAARIALAERSRELASLRVLGMTRGEISSILLGELAVLSLCAVPLGWLLGYQLGVLVFSTMTTDYFRIPMVMLPHTYGTSAAVVLLAAAASALVVRRKLDRLDLVEVLKTRE
jgi:putative ABC transport system permease protein